MQIGGISALALVHHNWPVWLDEAAREHEELHLSAGERGLQLRLTTAALIQLTRARVAAISRVRGLKAFNVKACAPDRNTSR